MKEKSKEIKSMHIKYVFTDEEKKELAGNLAQKISEKDSLELQKKEVASRITSEINTVNANIVRISEDYRQGYTWKNHDCYEIFDYDTKSVFTHRADTDDQVAARTMTSAEYQQEMFDPREKVDEVEILKDEELPE